MGLSQPKCNGLGVTPAGNTSVDTSANTGTPANTTCVTVVILVESIGSRPWGASEGEAVKPATVAPAPGSIIETTTRTRTVSDAQPIDQKTPSLWAYLTEVDRKGDWAKHIVYIHRISPQPSVPVQKCQQWLTAPNGQRTAICDEQEVEFALMTYFGGGEYRLMVKNGAQLMTTGKVFIDAPVRPMPAPTDTTGFGPGVVTVNSGTGMGDAATIAGKAIDTIAGQDREGVRIGMDALATAANVVRSFGEGRPGAQDDMTRQFMALMMARLAQDPMEQMVKFFTLMREMGSAMGTAGPTGVPADIMQKMFAVMFERFINPSPSGAPVSASAELVRQLPQVGNTIVQGLQEFRLAMEAQRDAIKAQQLGPRAVPTQAGPSPQIIPPMPTAAAPPANGAPRWNLWNSFRKKS